MAAGRAFAARALHELGQRARGGHVVDRVNLVRPARRRLLEAELFGHEEGAFTGAHRARAGRFRQADGGTLVLEGIEGIPNELQVKLLRTLQERLVEPLGGDGPVAVDVRVVATAGADLEAEVRAGRFREDLYYRLAVVVLRVPPLRARREELETLASQLLARASGRLGAASRVLSAAALERLQAHSWPGNVRELENALERVTVLGQPGPVTAHELDFLSEAGGDARDLARQALAGGVTLEQLERALIEEALVENRGNASAAARALGLSRRAFEYRRKKLEQAPDPSEEDEQT